MKKLTLKVTQKQIHFGLIFFLFVAAIWLGSTSKPPVEVEEVKVVDPASVSVVATPKSEEPIALNPTEGRVLGFGDFSCYNPLFPITGMHKDPLPKAIYYSEPKEIELQTCDIEKINDTKYIPGSDHKMYRRCGDKFNYVATTMYTAEIKLFPDLNHWGSTEPVIYDEEEAPNARNVYGTATNPSEPICSFLARITGNEYLQTSKDFRGKMYLYTVDEKGDGDPLVLTYSMPKLGSGVSCLNLISLLDTSNNMFADIPTDYPGFWYFGYDKDDKEIADEHGEQSLYQKISMTTSTFWEIFANSMVWFTELVGGFMKNLAEGMKDSLASFFGHSSSYERDYLIGEPVVEYEQLKKNNAFCQQGEEFTNPDYNGPAIQNISLVSGNDGMLGPEQIVGFDYLDFSLVDYCKNSGNPHVDVEGVGNELEYFCEVDWIEYKQKDVPDGAGGWYTKTVTIIHWKVKPEPPFQIIPGSGEGGNFKNITISKNYKIIDKVGVPGALSGLGRIYQYLQVRAKMVNQDLVAPINGTKFRVIMRYYDPFAEVEGDGFPDYTTLVVNSEFGSNNPFNIGQPFEVRQPYIKSKYIVHFILPFDISPYLRALQYNYNRTPGSADYHLGDNLLFTNNVDLDEVE